MTAIQTTLNELTSLSLTPVLPSSPSYNTHKTTPWSQTTHTSPSAFIPLSSAPSIAQVLPILSKNKTRFAVRTTGHNPNPGFSSVDGDGVVLDLSGLNGIEWMGEGGGKAEVKVGAGCRWGDVYDFVEGGGRSVIGGRDGGVGVGGFLLGGGLGAFPNLHGLGTDNITAMEMVTAKGEVIRTTPNQHPTLFKSLKGGLTNYGIVTSFTLRTHAPLHLTWNITLHPPTSQKAIHKAMLEMQSAMEEDARIGSFVNFNKDFVAVGCMYAEDRGAVEREGSKLGEIRAMKAFEDVDKIMGAAEGKTGGIGDLARGMSHATEEKKRCVGTLTTRPDGDLYEKIYEAWQDVVEDLPEGAVLHYTIQPVGSKAVEYGRERGGHVMNLQAEAQVWWVFTAEWLSPAEDATLISAVDNIVVKARALAEDRGVLLDYLCASFASGKQDVLGSYGAEMVGQMRDVARGWDPEGLFQRLQNGGFLLRGCK